MKKRDIDKFLAIDINSLKDLTVSADRNCDFSVLLEAMKQPVKSHSELRALISDIINTFHIFHITYIKVTRFKDLI